MGEVINIHAALKSPAHVHIEEPLPRPIVQPKYSKIPIDELGKMADHLDDPGFHILPTGKVSEQVASWSKVREDLKTMNSESPHSRKTVVAGKIAVTCLKGIARRTGKTPAEPTQTSYPKPRLVQ